MRKSGQYLLALIIAAAGLWVFSIGYHNLDPSINGARPNEVAGAKSDAQIKKEREEGRNQVAVTYAETGPYINRMGIAAGGLIGGVALLAIALKVATRERSPY